MRVALCALFAVSVACATGKPSNPTQLDRETAVATIMADPAFEQTETMQATAQLDPAKVQLGCDRLGDLDIAQSAGYITYRDSTLHGEFGAEYHVCAVTPTARYVALPASPTAATDAWRPREDPNSSDLPAVQWVSARAVIDSITGIAQAEGTTIAEVRYRWHWQNTPLSREPGLARPSEESIVHLQRFDTGWRPYVSEEERLRSVRRSALQRGF